jgi:hypothetical protein
LRFPLVQAHEAAVLHSIRSVVMFSVCLRACSACAVVGIVSTMLPASLRAHHVPCGSARHHSVNGALQRCESRARSEAEFQLERR